MYGLAVTCQLKPTAFDAPEERGYGAGSPPPQIRRKSCDDAGLGHSECWHLGAWCKGKHMGFWFLQFRFESGCPRSARKKGTLMWVCKKDCPNRSPKCHATCEAYKEFRKKQEEINEKKKKEQEIKDALFSVPHVKRKGGA